MHEKGASKTIFLSFQAISLIPDELQGRGKHYGCGLAGGEEGILWVVHECACFSVCMCVNMSFSEYICIIAKPCLMPEPFHCVFLFILVYVVRVCVCGCLDISLTHTILCPREKGLRSLEVAPKD